MALKKHTLALLMEIFVILPIILEARSYRGYNVNTHFHGNRENLEQWIFPNFEESATKSRYGHNNNAGREIKLRFGDGSNNGDSKDNIVFPDYVLQARSDGSNVKVESDPEPTCKHFAKQTFCEDVSNYPEELINRAFTSNPSLLNYAIRDVMDTAIANRIQKLDNDEQPLCISSERLILPKLGENVNNERLLIVQSDQWNFTQAIRIETCGEEGSSCKIIEDLAEGYSTICKQKFIYRQLSAISKDGEITRDFFRFPASCCCHIQFLSDLDELNN